MSNEIPFEQVRDFLAERWRVRPQELKPSTRLLHDLGIDADDAGEILAEFSERFGVDMSSFSFDHHFGTELDAGIRWVARKVFGQGATGKRPVTIQDLVEAANTRRWMEHAESKV